MSADIKLKCQQILDKKCTEYTVSSLKFGICMASYYRHNGNSRDYLRRSLNCVLNQTATNWHVYLVGDKYENNHEFEEMAQIVPKDKMTYINLPVAPEREHLSGVNLWCVGGVNAINYANKLALEDNCDYLLHLDDDDNWVETKIQMLNYLCRMFNNPSFLFHYSYYIGNSVIPKQTINNISINNLIPLRSQCIHSSYCAHKSVMKDFQYSGYLPNKQKYLEGDIQFLDYLHKCIKTNSATCLFIPFIMCGHLIEREAIALIPKKEYKILAYLEQHTLETSNIVKRISETMKGKTFHHHYHILYSLRDLIDKEKVVYCEIGTFNDGSLCLMMQHPKDVKLVSIDPFHLARTNKTIVEENIKTFNIFNRTVQLTEQFSNNPVFLKQLKDDEFKTDILFIDGDHSYKAVIEDFNNFQDFVNPGGFVVFDDYNDVKYSPEVFPAVNQIVKDIREKNLPFRIIGNPFNFSNVYPSDLKFLNEFIIQRI